MVLVLCLRLVSPLPIIRCPCDARLFRQDDAQDFAMRHPSRRMTTRPTLAAISPWLHAVSLVGRVDAMKANAIIPASYQRTVCGVRPAKRHRRTCRTAGFHSCVRQGGSIPNRFRKHAALIRKIFDRGDKRFWIAAGSEFVMAAFSC